MLLKFIGQARFYPLHFVVFFILTNSSLATQTYGPATIINDSPDKNDKIPHTLKRLMRKLNSPFGENILSKSFSGKLYTYTYRYDEFHQVIAIQNEVIYVNGKIKQINTTLIKDNIFNTSERLIKIETSR